MARLLMDPELVAEMIPTFRQCLIECGVTPGESVCLFSDARTNPFYAAAFFAAAKDLEATCFQLKVPYMLQSTINNPRAMATDAISDKGPLQAMMGADLIIDIASFGWLYTRVHNTVLDAGKRTLMVRQPEETLRRLLPHADVRRRVKAGAEVLTAGKKVHMTHPNGTDLHFNIEGRKGMFQYGASDIPGRWDHWPSGQCAAAPNEDGTEGVLVLNPGDVALRIHRYFMHPIKLTFKAGKLIDIAGEHGDAVMLRDQFAQWKDEKAYIPSHIGWGCDHRCNWMQMAYNTDFSPAGIMDAESMMGNVLLGIGNNIYRGLGGKNETPAHLDLCMRGYNFWVDDLQVLKDGNIVPASLQ